MPRIKQNPPMVGVPCFLLCQVGPLSRMVCPKCRRCSSGISTQPDSAVIENAPTAAATSPRPAIALPASAPPAAPTSIQETIIPMQTLPHYRMPHGRAARRTAYCIACLQCLIEPGKHVVQLHGVAGLGQQRVAGADVLP